EIAESVVLIWYQEADRDFASYGTGFAIDTLGHILTCDHVIANRKSVTVAFPVNGRERNLPAEIVARNPAIDTALLKIDYTGMKPVSLGSSMRLRMGNFLAFAGYPLGYTVEAELSPSLTTGYVSALRWWRVMPQGPRLRMLQIDCTVAIGTSGSPVFDPGTGAVVGMMKSHIRTAGMVLNDEDVLGAIQQLPQELAVSAGIGLAIPIDPIEGFLRASGVELP
ncbi:MAG: trypsin-like peptidase domain-containing protein, partial [Gemmatimonadetes bacterium]|nr:trypsin-like peptidase domain-containing protein [Gemmatimonadota bacterium]